LSGKTVFVLSLFSMTERCLSLSRMFLQLHARSLGNLLEDLYLLDRSPIDFEDEHEAQRSGLVGFDLEHMLDEEQFRPRTFWRFRM